MITIDGINSTPPEEVTVFKTANEFSQFIEQKAHDSGQSVLQVLIEYIEENEVDEDKIKPMISRSLYDKLWKCYIDLGLIRDKTPNLDAVLLCNTEEN